MLDSPAVRFASRAATIYIIGALVSTPVYLFLGMQSGLWQPMGLAVIGASLVFVGVISRRLSRAGEPGAATRLMLTAALLVVLILPLLVANLGLISGLAAFLLTMSMVPRTLPQWAVNRFLIISVGVGLAAGLLDLLEPTTQLSLPVLDVFFPILMGVVLLAFTFLTVRQFSSYSLPTKFILFFLAVSLLPLGLLTALNREITRSALIENASARLEQQAVSHALDLGSQLEHQIELASNWSQNPLLLDTLREANAAYLALPDEATWQSRELEWASASPTDAFVQGPLTNPAAEQLQTFHSLFPNHVELLLTDQYGGLVAATTRPPHYYQGEEAWWQAAREGVYLEQPRLEGKEALLTIAIPIYEEGGAQPMGTLRTFYRLNSTLRDAFDLVTLGQATSFATLLLPTGQQITTEQNTGHISASTLSSDQLAQLEQGASRIVLSGESSLVHQAPVVGATEESPIDMLGWRVLELEPLNTILAPVGRQLRLTILLALAIAGVVAATAFAGGQLLTRPILTLNAVVTRFAAGELSVRAPVEQEDEIGELATSFNVMAETLAERELHLEEAREVAEHANQAKSSFLAGMSHELRTPLNSIIGYAEIMLMGLNGELSPEMKEDVDAIHASGKHLLSLINDVLDLAKVEAGRMKLQYEEVDVAKLLKKIHDNNVSLVRKKPVEFKVDAEGELPRLPADPIRLTQILNNLVSNAIKHTEEGEVCLKARQEGEWIVLSVEDTGVGISQENIGAIFDEFSQVDRSSARRAEGTGLGLPITLRLIKLHGGTIDVQSTLDVGSTFTVKLPLQPPPSAEEVAEVEKSGKKPVATRTSTSA